ncbi:MAG: hypothetical protein V4538_15670 [Bacteroidota bacterium]
MSKMKIEEIEAIIDKHVDCSHNTVYGQNDAAKEIFEGFQSCQELNEKEITELKLQLKESIELLKRFHAPEYNHMAGIDLDITNYLIKLNGTSL